MIVTPHANRHYRIIRGRGPRAPRYRPARALEPVVAAKPLAQLDFRIGVVVNLRCHPAPAIAAGDTRNLLFLAIGRGDKPLFGDLKVALALDLGRSRFGPCWRGPCPLGGCQNSTFPPSRTKNGLFALVGNDIDDGAVTQQRQAHSKSPLRANNGYRN